MTQPASSREAEAAGKEHWLAQPWMYHAATSMLAGEEEEEVLWDGLPATAIAIDPIKSLNIFNSSSNTHFLKSNWHNRNYRPSAGKSTALVLNMFAFWPWL